MLNGLTGVCAVDGNLYLAVNDADDRCAGEFTAITEASPRISSGPLPVMAALDVETSRWEAKNTFFMRRPHLRTTGVTWLYLQPWLELVPVLV